MRPPLSAGLMTMSGRDFKDFSAFHSALERFDLLVFFLKSILEISYRHLSINKSRAEYSPGRGVHVDFLGKRLSMMLTSGDGETSCCSSAGSLSWKCAFKRSRRKKISASCFA